MNSMLVPSGSNNASGVKRKPAGRRSISSPGCDQSPGMRNVIVGVIFVSFIAQSVRKGSSLKFRDQLDLPGCVHDGNGPIHSGGAVLPRVVNSQQRADRSEKVGNADRALDHL